MVPLKTFLSYHIFYNGWVSTLVHFSYKRGLLQVLIFSFSELPEIADFVDDYVALEEGGAVPVGMDIAQLLGILVVILVRQKVKF